MAQGIAIQFERMGVDYRFLQEGQLSIENAQRYLYKVPLYDAAHERLICPLVNRALGLFAGISALSKQIAWYSEQDWSRYEGKSEGVRRVIYEQITEGQFIPTLIALTNTINQLMNMNAHLGKLSGMDDISQRFVNSLFLSSAYAMYPLELLEEKITHERTMAGKPEK